MDRKNLLQYLVTCPIYQLGTFRTKAQRITGTSTCSSMFYFVFIHGFSYKDTIFILYTNICLFCTILYFRIYFGAHRGPKSQSQGEINQMQHYHALLNHNFSTLRQNDKLLSLLQHKHIFGSFTPATFLQFRTICKSMKNYNTTLLHSNNTILLCFQVMVYYGTRWFKYDQDDLCVNKSQFVPVIFEPPCIS